MKTDIKAFCQRHGLNEAQFYGREKVGGSLYLSGLTSIPEGFNPTVGGSLYLRGLTSIPEGFNSTVGGSLYLSGKIKHIGSPIARQKTRCLEWQDGRYILSDGIFQEVVEHRGNVYRTRHIGRSEVGYLVTDGNGAWAHGDILEEAREDLLYKLGNRSVEEFKKLDPNAPLDFGTAVAMYRTVTGACAAGVRGFIERAGIAKDRTFTVLEIIELTKGAYGADAFVDFANTLKA